MVETITPDKTLDCKGLNCPMPILKTKKALAEMKSGKILEILGTDPATGNDLPAFASNTGHEYIGAKHEDGFTRYYLRVK
jgi:tRNA 2-thiouridine synthesizing protein A